MRRNDRLSKARFKTEENPFVKYILPSDTGEHSVEIKDI